MSPKKNKEKVNKVNKKALDKRNYFFFALIGVILIAVLMILHTRFKEYFRLNNDGFAVVSNTVTDYLSVNPAEEDVESLVKMHSFDALEYLYTQGGKFFLGEDEKTEVDTSYPVYMNQGAVLQVIEGSGVLYDEDYEREETYQGMYLEGGYAYNMDGQKADPCKYTFLGMNNGNFINFDTITYRYKNEKLDINENSLVHFDADYFSYFEYEKGELIYKYCISVTDSFKLQVGENEYTYDELLKLLGLRSEYPDIEGVAKEDTEDLIQEEEIPTEDLDTGAKVEVKKPEKKPVDPPSAPTPSSGGGNTNVSPGVRPENITRPGSSTDTEQLPEKVQGYAQPNVIINSVTANVYRIIVDATVYDPANRIDTNKYVRFEVYEVDKDGNEQLAMRGYRRGTGQNTTVLGGGAIKPETDYRVVSYYTYYDEYDREQYVDLGSWNVSTGKFEDLTDITLVHEQGNSYHNHIEIINFGYDAAVSDDELVYGINPYAGVKFTVKEKASGDVVTSRNLTTAEINNFKYNRGVVLNSLNSLKAKTEYQYEFEAVDYFDNEITLINNIGYAMTSNHAPNATIVEKVNEIGNIVLGVSIEDIDAAAVPSLDETDAADACDVYLILTKEDPIRYESKYKTFKEMEDAGIIVAYKKFAAGDYAYDPATGLTTPSELEITFNDLRLGEKLFACVYADYDLSNRMGPQYFKNIGQTSFKTSDLNSLGKIYVTSDLDLQNLTYKSLPMSFHLNKEATNDQLENLITGMKVEIVRGSGKGDDAVVDATFQFDENTLAADDVTKVIDMFKNSAVSYFADNLQSMTEYRINVTIYAKYQNEEYEITPQLTNYTFKTMRKPAEVTVQDLLFAAGTLVFDVKVADPDDTIVGVSGDKVVVQLYTQRGEFVKTVRVLKDLEEWQTVTFNNLDPSEKYELRFIAVEYNEGYTNASYISNKVLEIVKVDKSMSLDGTIKLQSINEISGDGEHYEAVVKATLSDPDYYLTGDDAIPYYIKVEKNGQLIEDIAFDLSTETPSTVYEKLHLYTVDKGENTYNLTMYIIVSGRVVELDTLSFTTETTVKGFSTAYEMIQFLKSDSDGKFVATNSFVLNSNSWNFKDVVDPGDVESMSSDKLKALGTGVSGANIVNIFNGNIDFQGFTLSHNIYADNQRMFANIGSKGIVQNLVYSVKNLNTTRIYDDAAMCYRNFGTIRDIYVKYRGGYVLNNDVYGLLARVNSSTGIIENFVIENTPEEGWAGFSTYRYAGLVTYENYGIIRYGYVTGDNIIMTAIDQSITREVGGIVGANRTLGSVYSVYSLVNADDTKTRPDPYSAYTYSNYYGAVCGQSWGKMSNMYSAKDSALVESKHNGNYGYQHSPVIGGRNNATISNIYYYSEETYSEALSRAKAYTLELNQLYDVSWQNSILTDEFDTSLVEVGYYPHVRMSADLPEQPYIPLPTRVMEQPVEISRATVLDYGTMEDGVTDYATVQFVFTNRDGFDIVGINIKDIDVELDLQTAKYEDGYTTIIGVISNPRTFTSEYEIQSVTYYRNGKLTNNAISFTLKADFFRKIYTVDDWYTYMVNRKNEAEFENVRLENDLDFAGVDASRIMVKLKYNRILDGTDSEGNMHTLKNIDLQYGFNATNNTTLRRLFGGDLQYSGVIRNLYIENYRAGGSYYSASKGKTFVSRAAAVVGTVYGNVENVHLKDAEITTYDYAAGIACYVAPSGEIKDCSVTNLKINYNDPDDANAESYVGGIAGRLNESRVTHCYVQGIDIQVDETKSTFGIGGVVGYAVNSVIDTAYAEGKIVSRAQKVGGIVGNYYCTNASVACMKNMWAKVDIICYTDVAGALVGQTNITQDRISETNNFTGVGIGNVYLSNLDSKNSSQTIGVNLGKNVKFYGTQEQLINGIAGVGYEGKEDCIIGLLTYNDLMNNAHESYFEKIGFEDVYSMEGTADGLLPKMYYTGSKELLPNQTDIVLDELKDVDIEVTNVIHNDVDRIVTVELRNPNHYKITSINIRDLKYHFVDMTKGQQYYPNAVTIDKGSDYDSAKGITRIYLQYDEEQSQDYFLDSYVMDNITFYPVDNSGLDTSLLAANIAAENVRGIPIYSRINVMLCKNIPNVGEWNKIPIREQQGHVYENYRVTGELDFNNVETAMNLKIGRLISDNGDRTISNVNIDGYDKHLMSRLNSGIKGLNFDNIIIKSETVGCVGIVGVSNGTVLNCDFSNITITPKTNNMDEVGIIGHSNGGVFDNITMNNISVNNAKKANLDYVGGLIGKTQDGSSFTNITAENITVVGSGSYAGGVLGASEMSDVKNIVLKDITVTNSGGYTGGFGGQVGYSSNASAKEMWNVEITGTATYDSEGRVIDSTTKITGNNYVGGVVGHTHQKVGNAYQASKQEPNMYVDGVVVSGLQRMGGAFGGSYTSLYHVTVKNALIETRDAIFSATTAYTSVGGVIGETTYSVLRAVRAENIIIDVQNVNYIGGISGMHRLASVQYAFAKDCIIKAGKASAYTGTLSNVGGVMGMYENTMYYSGAMNTIIDAPQHTNVGGVVGRLSQSLANNHYVGNCFYLCNYDEMEQLEFESGGGTRYTAAALDKYYIKGKTNVGGIVGMQNSGYVYQSYSNGNVIAEDYHIAGGIVGMYCNEYSTTVSNGKVNYTYSIASMYKNYFAGTVTAVNGYAGGAIGRTGILYRTQGTGEGEKNGNRIKNVNANCNEADKTYGNIIIADRITGGKNTTGAFAADDTTFVFIGRDNRIWDKTIINDGTGDTYAAAIIYNGDYAYDYWVDKAADGSALIGYPQKLNEMNVFESTDLDGSKFTNPYHNRASVFYRTAGWSLSSLNDPNQDYAGRDQTIRVSVGDVPTDGGGTRGLKNKYEATGYDTGTYLPQPRESTSRPYKNDAVIKAQEEICRLPLPRDKGDARTISLSTGFGGRMVETTYGTVYASDVDKLNVEFSSDLVDEGYFTLKAGENVIAHEMITQRTYTFSYPFNQTITFEYGFLKETSLEEDALLEGTNLDEFESVLLGNNDLKTDIMVYHNDYYYISDEGLVSSVGTWTGDFVHVMNGKLLDSNGNIWDVESRTKEGTVSATAMLEDEKALWNFNYGSMDIATYARYSSIESEYNTVERNAQIFVVKDELYTVDGTLETRKTDILIYTLNGEMYQTVLGNDGMMVDMMQDDWNIPEEVDNQAIVRMSNTLDASVPYVLVEYNNGGIIGYNYATGEILFDNTVESNVSLLDYARNFFSGNNESQYANISNTYSANADLSNRINSTADLEKIVGNSSGELIKDNGNGENTSSAIGEKDKADSGNAQAGTGVEGTGDAINGQGSNEDGTIGTDDGTEGTFVSTSESENESSDKNETGFDETKPEDAEDSNSEQSSGSSEKKNEQSSEDETSQDDDTTSEEEPQDENKNEGTEGEKDSSGDKQSDEETKEEGNEGGHRTPAEDDTIGAGEFMTVYNNETGVYEIVSVAEYLTKDAYISENQKLGIKDLSQHVSGYAQSKVDVNQERGILMYIIPILIIFSIAGGIIIYVKRKERRA